MKRRTFLLRTAGLGVAISSSWASRLAAMSSSQLEGLPEGGGLDGQQWRTIVAVQEHLLPAEDNSPGAADIHAAHYLHFVLSDKTLEAAGRKFIIDGTTKFEILVQSRFGKQFDGLTEEQKETSLREFESDSVGRKWITELLGYIFEALLTDPVYGGNPNGVGWKWLGHRPGFPRPTADKVYWKLEQV